MIFIYFLSFMILWEWLRPLPVITDTGNLHVFVWFTLFCFVVMYLRLAFYITIPLFFIVMMYGLHSIFYEGPFVKEGLSTLILFGEDVARNITFLLGSQMDLLTYEFRSFLLFLVLAITSYLVHFWIFHLKKIFWFLVITIVYVTIIDTFTIYDASSAIIRLVVAGFFLMTILFKMRLEEREKVSSDEFRGKAWTNILTTIIIAVVAAAFFMPKYEPYWPDPLPMVQSVATGEGVGESAVQTIGYGQNDERLGGGFVQDDSVVFTAVSKQRHYWRGESKEIYTGHGWVSLEPELNKTFRYSDVYDESVAVQLYDRNVPKEKLEATITMRNDARFWHFFYPGELIEVNENQIEFYSDSQGSPFQFLIDYLTGKVGTTNAEDESALFLQEYTLTYYQPEFVIDDLLASSENDPEHIKEMYLQLPNVPDRVGQLAEEITDEFNTRYDKVKAIEGYFSENDFLYETEDVPRPEEGQDYVDQFLFETRRGYCDNYSTAMIVMLRSLDIPARWVKGFTQGELIEYIAEGYREYEVSNSNAHSWVEVYFPEVGWVPFEPTQGFSHTYDFVEAEVDTEDTSLDDEVEREDEAPLERENDPENPFLPLEDMEGLEDSASSAGGQKSSQGSFNFPFKFVWVIIAASLIGFLIHQNRKKLVTSLFLYVFKLKSNNKNNYMKVYERLLWLLAYNGYKRADGETLREYASRIDRELGCTEMQQLTLYYEKLYYGNGKEHYLSVENKDAWEVLVKKMSS
ncbi:hypothetical protein BKP35_05650 [Anaerobacillus arseniciselenatis]|uniref:Transglutaminase-like domain-containing protein n=2 Tax=Anaerobacillus arseniciselenatis TaxID=85682 RepID=A0A1S2LQY7_9BACI|nr:hypothetical protein BKP35_05650 [Anaerobacillus arseniciselenatis]